jgi:hypothetical protein
LGRGVHVWRSASCGKVYEPFWDQCGAMLSNAAMGGMEEMGEFYDICLKELYPPGTCGTFCNEARPTARTPAPGSQRSLPRRLTRRFPQHTFECFMAEVPQHPAVAGDAHCRGPWFIAANARFRIAGPGELLR